MQLDAEAGHRFERTLRGAAHHQQRAVDHQAGLQHVDHPAGERLEVEIRGHDLDESDRLTGKVMEVMRGIEGISDVTASREEGNPELRGVVDREKAQADGLTAWQVRETVPTDLPGSEF